MPSDQMTSVTKNESGELVYGTESTSSTDESRVMSEKVQQMANCIYKEFERMIKQFGENSVKELMPLVVGVLEALDLTHLEKEEHEVELELLKEDNEQLITQYEREKAQRKLVEQRCMQLEDVFEDQKNELQEKMESLESIVRMLELRGKNSNDHVSRLEDRETEMKQEYAKLHERYTELFRTHMDYMERTKFLMGVDKFDSNSIGDSVKRVSRFTGFSQECAKDLPNESRCKETGRRRGKCSSTVGNDYGNVEEMQEMPAAKVEEAETKTSAVGSAPSVDTSDESIAGVDLTGMGREVENLIKENAELLETKNALNIVKDDLIAQVDNLISEQDILKEEIRSLEMVRAKMIDRINELETELKEAKQSLEQKDDGSDVPMAHRKRFTRIEMARVLMERNQYKEKFMELQEAIKWSEMIRASRGDPSLKRKRGSIWDFFSGLFSPNATSENDHFVVHLKYNAQASNLLPGSDMVPRSGDGARPKALDFLVSANSSERRASERKEQYKLVQAHVKKDDSGRVQAYGWSIPPGENPLYSVPVPVYCQPLFENMPSLKIWCACSVDLSGGFTKDGGFIIGSSVFYNKEKLASNLPALADPSASELENLNRELQFKQIELQEEQNKEWKRSNLLWVCSSAKGRGVVSVIHANKPDDVIDTFDISSSHILCACSVRGAELIDYVSNAFLDRSIARSGVAQDEGEETVMLGAVSWIHFEQGGDGVFRSKKAANAPSTEREDSFNANLTIVESSEEASEVLISSVCSTTDETNASCSNESPSSGRRRDSTNEDDLAQVDAEEEYKSRLLKHMPEHIKDGLQKFADYLSFATILPTVWMGCHNGRLYIHSAVFEWKKCLGVVELQDAILDIVHYRGRAFVALANGTIAIFCRQKNGEWSMDGCYILVVGISSCSVRCVVVVGNKLWCGYRNKIFIINPETLEIEHHFDAHPRRESQVRQLACLADGVWCSIRLDSSLRLFHAKTYAHLQDVDIEPYVSKMLGASKLSFSFVRITALLLSCKRLWVGTGNGVVLSIPLASDPAEKMSSVALDSSSRLLPGEAVRIYAEDAGSRESVSPASFVPYCKLQMAQMSYHGHRDSVKFLVSTPAVECCDRVKSIETPSEIGNQSEGAMCVISGGEGYIDFRIGDEEDADAVRCFGHRREWSHLIVWEVKCDN